MSSFGRSVSVPGTSFRQSAHSRSHHAYAGSSQSDSASESDGRSHPETPDDPEQLRVKYRELSSQLDRLQKENATVQNDGERIQAEIAVLTKEMAEIQQRLAHC
jgi:peptidoglycan hydrolase CwlO-like protein